MGIPTFLVALQEGIATMEEFALLRLGVEASIALAGFSGIIATFQFRDASMVRRGPAAALTMVVQLSLVGALLSALPLGLNLFGVSGRSLWAICSAIQVVVTGWLMYGIAKNLRGSLKTRSTWLIFGSFQGAVALLLLANVLNAADMVFHREPGPYVVQLMMGLIIAAYMFSRLLLLPVWRAVRNNEEAEPPIGNVDDSKPTT